MSPQKIWQWVLVFMLIGLSAATMGQIIVDHSCTDISQIPQAAIEQAKATLHIGYGHTSHGSQITDGMRGLINFANNGGKGLSLPENSFAFNNGGSNGALDFQEGDGYGNGWLDHDCGYYPNWVNETREYLDDPSHSDVNVIMWSWCGQASSRSEQQMIDTYLAPMTQLEADYPHVTFVYMTGHADGSGEGGNLHQRNRQIREYCEQHGKVLFDFYDIECYDPDGNYYGDLDVDDACNYNGGNWAVEWQNSHQQGVDWYHCGSAHSQPLNANQKAYAAWWLWARLAGWTGPVQDATPPSVPQHLSAAPIGETEIELSWSAATDAESGVSRYNLYRDDEFLAATVDTAYSDESCTPGVTYSYAVAAVNGAGVESEQSTSVHVTTPSDTEPPTVPASFSANPVSSTEIQLSWQAATDNSGSADYVIRRDGVDIAETSDMNYTDAGLSPSTTYAYEIAAKDAAGNMSAFCEPVQATTLDPSREEHFMRLENRDEVDDSFLFSSAPNSNYGAEPYRNSIDHFILKFNLPAELTGKQILEAKLGLYVWHQTNYQDNEHLNLYCVTRPWKEDQVTWMHAQEDSLWQTPGGDCDMNAPVAQIPHQAGSENWDHAFYPEADMTALVQQWTDGARENYGFLIMNDGQTNIGFKASEYSNGSRSYLEIRYTDKLPAAVEQKPVPNNYQLHANYPNPFNPQTTIQFELPAPEQVQLDIYDIQGRLIETLLNETCAAGRHQVVWRAEQQAAGLYFYRLRTGSFQQVRRMILVK